MPDDDDDDGDADDSPVLQYLRHDSFKGNSDPESSHVPGSKREVPEVRSTLVSLTALVHLPLLDRLSVSSPPLGVTTHAVTDSSCLR